MDLQNRLKEAGYTTELSVVTDVVGSHHAFDILVLPRGTADSDERVPIEVRSAGEGEEAVDAQEIFRIKAKLRNSRISSAIVVARPRASEEARKLAKAFGWTIVEGTDPEMLAQEISRSPALQPRLALK